MNNKINFCNGVSECGCEMRYRDGHGQYSDSHTITICDVHSGRELLNKIAAEIELANEPGKSEPDGLVLSSVMHMISEAKGK